MARRPEPEARRLVNATLVPLRPPAGSRAPLSGTIIILDDVTDRARLEEQLQISDKMASIGLLAAGVAHEVNTPLTGISSFTQMLLDGADPGDPKTRMLEKIERQTFRAAKIVNGLLNLSRPGGQEDAAPVPVDLNAVVTDVLSLLEHQLKVGRIQVRRELASPAPVVSGVEYKLQQVFLNLFLNARDAMPKGGWLSITTRADGASGVAEVGDTGAGIPSEHLSRIYDPFFTTKAMGQGTGLGLSITYGIVHEHDGSIRCDSALGAGHALHRVVPPGVGGRRGVEPRGPLTAARGARMSNPGVGSGVTNESETKMGAVLVIDDEEIMREILETLLTREGYEVTLAASGAEGLELAQAATFDAAIVDVMMPEMDGLETLDELKKIDEDLAVIMITAFASVETAIAAMKRGAFDYITKPFKNDEVLVVLRNAVERRQLVVENRALRQNLQERYQQVRRTSSAAARGCGRCST